MVDAPFFNEAESPSMRPTVPLAVAVLALTAACENMTDIRGFAPAPGAVDKLEVGTQSREDVQRLIGSPSAVATFNPNVWYYIREKQEGWGPSKPWITDQNVIQVTCNETGRLEQMNDCAPEDA